jgi:hypothetical protein
LAEVVDDLARFASHEQHLALMGLRHDVAFETVL